MALSRLVEARPPVGRTRAAQATGNARPDSSTSSPNRCPGTSERQEPTAEGHRRRRDQHPDERAGVQPDTQPPADNSEIHRRCNREHRPEPEAPHMPIFVVITDPPVHGVNRSPKSSRVSGQPHAVCEAHRISLAPMPSYRRIDLSISAKEDRDDHYQRGHERHPPSQVGHRRSDSVHCPRPAYRRLGGPSPSLAPVLAGTLMQET